MSTTLPLFWHLSSTSKKERLDASVKLVGALEHFQAQFVPKSSSEGLSEDEEDQGHSAGSRGDGLDVLNAQDVSYSIRRLVRGLASPRESSRLGFAVALTELLSRIDSVTCSQIVALILDSAKTQGSSTGQEERDVLFARLFGLTSVIQSGLLVRDSPLSTSASSAPAASTLSSYQELISELVALGEKKSWIRESAWWTIGLAVDTLGASEVLWKDEALESTIQSILVENKIWTPEKIALTLKLQKLCPSRDWSKILSPTFKHSHLLSTGNYSTIARILKEFSMDEEDEKEAPKSKSGSWKPQVHFVWDILLDEVLSEDDSESSTRGSFPEFFRILVDESLFSSTSSPERKYWGFQVFQKALPRVREADVPMLFTKNFMRSWINHLSNSDRYLHKIAKQVANDIQTVVKNNPRLGFTLILQLTGVHGSHQFDKLTKTKTVETLLTTMDNEGIQSYIEYLLKQVNDEQASQTTDIQALNARRAWIVDQLAALIRNGAVPKDDKWIQTVLDWFVIHGLFTVFRRSEKSKTLALRDIPAPIFSDELRKLCRSKLLSCLAELTGQTTVITTGDKTVKVAAVASDGQFWVSKVLSSIGRLEKDGKHVSPLSEVEEGDKAIHGEARALIERLNKISDEQREAAKGAELLVSATLLHHYCTDDEEEADAETLQSCIDGASRMFPAESKKTKKSRRPSTTTEDEGPEPIDVLVDTVIGFLEQATAYMRAVANQVFSLLSSAVCESTIDLILAQLERREPGEIADDDADMENEPEDDDESDEDNSGSSENGDLEDDEDLDDAGDPELRQKIEEALRVNGIHAATEDSDAESEEETMDDDQMMAIDAQLAAVFRARADEKKFGKGVDAQREATHYKNRVLDLLDSYIKKQPTSPFITRLILPLVELVVSSGTDEKQLADKATGILRSRIGKSKDMPSTVEADQAGEILREVHLRARKALSADVLTTLSQCSLFLVRCLTHAKDDSTVVKAYRDSLVDFVTRKASRLNANFFQDFIKRHPAVAWGFRSDLLDVIGKAVNGYRRTQVFQLLQTLTAQLPTITNRDTEILEFMPGLRNAVQESVRDACSEESLTAAQVKELLKLALSAIRQTKRVASQEQLHTIWEPSSWETLSSALASADRFKSSTALQTMCKQISQLVTEGKLSKAKAPGKRKVDSLEGEEEVAASPKKVKRKKTKGKI
ncbi:hypothetical protein PHLCEN_2v2053 [Hermanssonia centrifuga]|uniref:DNA polymerase V n=1 Tax=Hermanssonia centrifuga TaxID=98765 RepID=A0A2R6RQ79_9APHY|nr:hypothetical protein PHLCEN_2v2053 [Hermanssonia centrifuga]